MQLGQLAIAVRLAFASIGAGLFGYLVIDLFILLPIRAFGSVDKFYAPLSPERLTNILALLVAWTVVSVIVLIFLTVRLGSKRTWPANFPYSLWRILRSLALYVAVVCAGSVLPGFVMSSAPVVADSVELTVRNWELAVPLIAVGFWALVVTAAMFCTGGIIRLVRAAREE